MTNLPDTTGVRSTMKYFRNHLMPALVALTALATSESVGQPLLGDPGLLAIERVTGELTTSPGDPSQNQQFDSGFVARGSLFPAVSFQQLAPTSALGTRQEEIIEGSFVLSREVVDEAADGAGSQVSAFAETFFYGAPSVPGTSLAEGTTMAIGQHLGGSVLVSSDDSFGAIDVSSGLSFSIDVTGLTFVETVKLALTVNFVGELAGNSTFDFLTGLFFPEVVDPVSRDVREVFSLNEKAQPRFSDDPARGYALTQQFAIPSEFSSGILGDSNIRTDPQGAQATITNGFGLFEDLDDLERALGGPHDVQAQVTFDLAIDSDEPVPLFLASQIKATASTEEGSLLPQAALADYNDSYFVTLEVLTPGAFFRLPGPVTVVPEPASLATLGVAFCAVLVSRRRGSRYQGLPRFC